jgi:predicted nucleic acid-binding protein
VTLGVLVDAGPLIAILNRNDRDHAACVAALKKLRDPMLTTWMPITEAMHLLGFSSDAQDALLEFIDRGALRILPIDDSDLGSIRKLMTQYADLPMDFADASLVHAAIREGLRDVFTLDRADFGVYRLGPRRGFRIVPV